MLFENFKCNDTIIKYCIKFRKSFRKHPFGFICCYNSEKLFVQDHIYVCRYFKITFTDYTKKYNVYFSFKFLYL